MATLCAVALIGCSTKAGDHFEAQAVASESIRRHLAEPEVDAVGGIVSVITPTSTWNQAFGKADAVGQPMTTELGFRVASISKTFTAATVLRLADQGRLATSDRISKYLPNPDTKRFPNWDSITIQQLGSHTSGLTEVTDSPEFVRQHLADPRKHWEPKRLLDFVHQATPPGKAFGYSNANYVVLGLLVEQLTQTALASVVSKEFLVPLRLKHTMFAQSGKSPALACRGFMGTTDVTEHDPSWAWGAGSMISDVNDLSRWMSALCSGKVLSPASTVALLKVEKPARSTSFGVSHMGDWLGHTGRIEGYSSACFYNPKLEATVVVLVNRMDPADSDKNISREIPILNDVISAFFPRR